MKAWFVKINRSSTEVLFDDVSIEVGISFDPNVEIWRTGEERISRKYTMVESKAAALGLNTGEPADTSFPG